MTNQRRKLLYVVNSLVAGGTERLVVDMARVFSADYDLTVVCLDEPGVWAQRLRRAGICVLSLWRQPGIDLAMASSLAGICRNLKIDIVHAHQTTPWFYAALSRLFYSHPKLLFEEHGRFFPETSSLMRRMLNRLVIARLTHRTVAVSEDIRRRLDRYEGIGEEDIDVIYNGIEAPARIDASERRALRTGLGFSDDDFIVGSVGRLDPIKNYSLLIDSIRDASEDCESVRGLLIGDGPERKSLQARAKGTGESSAIVLTGFREDARQLVQCIDLFVLSSLSEGTSVALLEAMACSIPVIVTDVGGNSEVVAAGSSGWVVPSECTESMSNAICEAVRDKKRAVELAEEGHRRFKTVFSFDNMIASYTQVYDELLH